MKTYIALIRRRRAALFDRRNRTTDTVDAIAKAQAFTDRRATNPELAQTRFAAASSKYRRRREHRRRVIPIDNRPRFLRNQHRKDHDHDPTLHPH